MLHFQSNSYERQLVRFEFDTAFAQLDEATQRAMGHQKEDFIIDCSFNEVHCSHEYVEYAICGKSEGLGWHI